MSAHIHVNRMGYCVVHLVGEGLKKGRNPASSAALGTELLMRLTPFGGALIKWCCCRTDTLCLRSLLDHDLTLKPDVQIVSLHLKA